MLLLILIFIKKMKNHAKNIKYMITNLVLEYYSFLIFNS